MNTFNGRDSLSSVCVLVLSTVEVLMPTIKYSQYKDFIIFFSVILFGNIMHFHMQQKKVFLWVLVL